MLPELAGEASPRCRLPVQMILLTRFHQCEGRWLGRLQVNQVDLRRHGGGAGHDDEAPAARHADVNPEHLVVLHEEAVVALLRLAELMRPKLARPMLRVHLAGVSMIRLAFEKPQSMAKQKSHITVV